MRRIRAWQGGVAILGFALLAAAIGSTSRDAWAHAKGYVLAPLVFLGDPAPGGGTFAGAFESNFINHRGDVLFGASVAPAGDAGLFILRKGVLSQIARAGEAAPGGSMFVNPGFLSPTALNARGHVAFAFLLAPSLFPPESMQASIDSLR
jgi:hypothetical protein